MKQLHTLLTCLLLFAVLSGYTQTPEPMHQFEERGMSVKLNQWNNHWQVEMSAPTTGWVTIGFNEGSALTGAWLLMGRVRNGIAEVIEHKTLKPGDYRPIAALGGTTSVAEVQGAESGTTTTLRFSIPVQAAGKHQKTLAKDTTYTLIMAYSREDDFQHHSTMRTSKSITL